MPEAEDRYRPYAGIWFVSVCLFGLIPFALVAAKLWTGTILGHQYRFQLNCAGVFTHHNRVWGQMATLIKRGESTWEQVDQDILSPMPIAGYRVRWDRMTWEADRKKQSAFWQRSLGLVAEKMQSLSPDQPPITEVRVIKVLQRSTEREAVSPEGAWCVPPYAQLSKNQYVDVAHYLRRGDAWIPRPKPGPTATQLASAPQGGSASPPSFLPKSDGARNLPPVTNGVRPNQKRRSLPPMGPTAVSGGLRSSTLQAP
jgi:hypothetical protein